jgi:hypothetical protein
LQTKEKAAGVSFGKLVKQLLLPLESRAFDTRHDYMRPQKSRKTCDSMGLCLSASSERMRTKKKMRDHEEVLIVRLWSMEKKTFWKSKKESNALGADATRHPTLSTRKKNMNVASCGRDVTNIVSSMKCLVTILIRPKKTISADRSEI